MNIKIEYVMIITIEQFTQKQEQLLDILEIGKRTKTLTNFKINKN